MAHHRGNVSPSHPTQRGEDDRSTAPPPLIGSTRPKSWDDKRSRAGVALSAGQVLLTGGYDATAGQLLREASRGLLNLTAALQAVSKSSNQSLIRYSINQSIY